MMSAYLNGSAINVAYHNNPVRYTGGYVTEDFFLGLTRGPVFAKTLRALPFEFLPNRKKRWLTPAICFVSQRLS